MSEQRSDNSANWLTVYPAETSQEREQLLVISKLLGNLPDTQEIVLALSDAIESKVLRGEKLSERDIVLLQKVFDYITEGIEKGVDEAVSLKLRRLTDSEIKEREKERGQTENKVEVWSYYSGDYRGQMIGESELKRKKHPLTPAYTGRSERINSEEYVPHKEHGDTVEFLRSRIEDLLKINNDRPVVVVDIGAMYATTLLELALVFKNEILNGRLVLIATNIGLNRQTIESASKPTNGNPLSRSYEELYSKARDLVHFVTTDIEHLKDRTISLPNEKTLQLSSGTVDIAHENWSISAHSTSLEKDIADLADLVGNSGIIMSRKNDPKRGSGGLVRDRKETQYLPSADFTVSRLSRAKMKDPVEQYEIQREFRTRDIPREMKLAAIQTLLQRGLVLVDNVNNPEDRQKHTLNYSFFVGKNAQPLHFYTEKGREIFVSPKKQNLGGIFKKVRHILSSI